MGVKDLVQDPVSYLRTRGTLLWSLVGAWTELRSRSRQRFSWDELIDFAFNFSNGLLRPRQIVSEIRCALEEIEKVCPSRILEIGTASGGTFFLLARTAKVNAVLISLDLPGGRWGGGYSTWKELLFRQMLLPQQTAYFIRADSHASSSLEKVQTHLRSVALDVLFIDGDHSYEGVRHDFLSYGKLVRAGGLIVMHDIAPHPPEKGCQVEFFWSKLKQHYAARIEIVEDYQQGWAGIGIVRQDKEAFARVASDT